MFPTLSPFSVVSYTILKLTFICIIHLLKAFSVTLALHSWLKDLITHPIIVTLLLTPVLCFQVRLHDCLIFVFLGMETAPFRIQPSHICQNFAFKAAVACFCLIIYPVDEGCTFYTQASSHWLLAQLRLICFDFISVRSRLRAIVGASTNWRYSVH